MKNDQPNSSVAEAVTPPVNGDAVPAELEHLQTSLLQAQESERRAIADYHNLMRRTQEERVKMVKLAGREIIEGLLQPLEHLYLAKEQLKDKGLDMVYQQFQQALRSEGVEEIECLGKEFDPHTMEVVGKESVKESKQIDKVVKIAQRGYRLNGEVIRHVKVVVGEKGV
jgi:molecular chaperone GrpE